jgi:hypothetical protein
VLPRSRGYSETLAGDAALSERRRSGYLGAIMRLGGCGIGDIAFGWGWLRNELEKRTDGNGVGERELARPRFTKAFRRKNSS